MSVETNADSRALCSLSLFALNFWARSVRRIDLRFTPDALCCYKCLPTGEYEIFTVHAALRGCLVRPNHD